ncbi:MAG TPA: hypothetical protein VFC07_11125, partial [Verrucomicrobiae bacterium]|nr:hypothetical protein [Verrucomicrobiae bacterium]
MMQPPLTFANLGKLSRAISRICPGLALLFWLVLATAPARALPTVVQNGNTLTMSNVNVTVQYNLGTGKANFYWQNSLKISGFYAGFELTSYVTGTSYSVRTYSVSNNTVIVTSTGTG